MRKIRTYTCGQRTSASGDRQLGTGTGTFTVSLPVFLVARRRNFIWVTVTIYAAATDEEPWPRSGQWTLGMAVGLGMRMRCCESVPDSPWRHSSRSEQIDGNCRRAEIAATFKSNFM